MADHATNHHFTQGIDRGNEDRRFHIGILVVECPKDRVTVGGLVPHDSRAKKCNICQAIGHMARDCPDKSKLQPCKLCGTAGHTKVHCPQIVCSNCHESGHVKSSCEKPVHCRTCKEPGHMSKDCPDKPDAQLSPCTSCGGFGHKGPDDCFIPRTANGASGSQPDTVKSASGPDTANGTSGPDTANGASGPDTANSASGPDTANSTSDSQPDTVTTQSAGNVPDDDVSSHEGDEGDEESAEPEPPAPPPEGRLSDENFVRLTVKMHTINSAKHISMLAFGFEGSFQSSAPNSKDGFEHKSALIAFTEDNMMTAFNVKPIEPSDPEFTSRVSSSEAAIAEHQVGLEDQAHLYHFQVVVTTLPTVLDKAAEDGNRPLYGHAFYSHQHFGPFEGDFGRARDILLHETTTLHFFTVTTADFVTRLLTLQTSMEEQNQSSPLKDWWKDGRLNPQLGMEVKQDERPNEFKVSRRRSFLSLYEYVTMQFHALVHEYEQIKRQRHEETVVRMGTFPGGGDQVYYVHIDIPEGAHYREGTVIRMKLHRNGPDADDWQVIVLAPTGYAGARQVAAFAFRPRLGQSFVLDPELEEGKHYVNTQNYPTSEEISTAMSSLPGIRCYAREDSPRVGVKRAINTLNHLFKGKQYFSHERQLLQTNHLRDFEPVNYFQKLIDVYGGAIVDAEMERMKGLLGEEQRQVVPALQAMRGGVLLVQGPGGVGKSEIIVALSRLQYRLQALHGREKVGSLWTVSPINKQLDDLSEKIDKACVQEYQQCMAEGHKVAYPIVIRRHMGATERNVVRGPSKLEAEKKNSEQQPAYYEAEQEEETQAAADPEDDEDPEVVRSRALIRMVVTDKRLQQPFADKKAFSFDKRLKHEHLSEGRWVLRRIGYPDPGERQAHAIADKVKWASLRLLLERVADGQALDETEVEDITLLSNQVVGELATMCTTICMTPDVVSQTRAHMLQQPFAVLHDEAGKTPEMGTLAALLFSRPYSVGNGPMVVQPDSSIPHVLFGDIYQPRPVLGSASQTHPFGQQNGESIFHRLALGGIDTVWLWEQHRSNSDIIDLINYILPRGRMRVAPGVDDRPESAIASRAAREHFQSQTRVVFLDVEGNTEVLSPSQSRYNDGFVGYGISAATKLIQAGFAGKQVAIIAAYTAQVATYRHGMTRFVEWCLAQKQDSKWFRLSAHLNDVEIFTVDKMQGGQQEAIVHCTTTSSDLGFTIEATRQLLANGRARSFLAIIGDTSGVEAAYDGTGKRQLRSSAYYQVVTWCREHRSYLNLVRKPSLRRKFSLPRRFAIADILATYHTHLPPNDPPLSLDDSEDESDAGKEEEEDSEEDSVGGFGGGGFQQDPGVGEGGFQQDPGAGSSTVWGEGGTEQDPGVGSSKGWG